MKPPSDRGKTAVAEPAAAPATVQSDPPRGTIAEWAITILLLLFGTTTLVQAFVIPTGSMEDTLLIGDHLLVDKLAFAPAGKFSKYILPYQEPQHGDIIVFRYPVDISQTFVKRTIGVPGDHIKIINQQVYRNGVKLNEPYVYHKNPYPDSFRDNFPSSEPNLMLSDPAREGDEGGRGDLEQPRHPCNLEPSLGLRWRILQRECRSDGLRVCRGLQGQRAHLPHRCSRRERCR